MSEDQQRKHTLRELREARGLSREKLAVELETSFSTITNIESGRNRPRVELAERIYQFFGVPVGSIEWGREEKPQGKARAAVA